MAIKKSQLYSSLWKSCDELRGGMDASQYKDYVLTLLFMKYVSDKYERSPNALIEVPEGGSFADMVKLKGDKEIGDKINKIIARLAEANDLRGVIDQADFNDESKLGSGKEMQDRLSKLVAIFDGLDFRANRAEGDDLLGDAYEYLMRHFATESGKSKGQFYTPAEVSRIMAQVIGIDGAGELDEPTVYDPSCGSGSLLIKAADEARTPRLAIYGQEMDVATWALARMNMILHGHPTAELWRGNTLSSPHFKNRGGTLRRFDFAVANPPFSAKSWSNGLDPVNDEFDRFELGIPPAKNGDYAFLLHFVASLKSTGTGAIILPHGVLFRGNREADIRRNLVRRGYIKGIIGLPANLFYGTGIPACILVIDKEEASNRRSVFMIDASRGYVKDGNKNRLRAQDIHKIVDVFRQQQEIPGYSRKVSLEEIGSDANDFNLNLPRYIDSTDPEDLHDLHAHLNGGIPDRDIDALEEYWTVFPTLRNALFQKNGREGYSDPRLAGESVRNAILDHREFQTFADHASALLDGWRSAHEPLLRGIDGNTLPRQIIRTLAEDLLQRFEDLPLVNAYDVYQRLMEYWEGVLQDDVYLIVAEGWGAGRMLREPYDKEPAEFSIRQGRKTRKYVGELVPAPLVIAHFFLEQQEEVDRLSARLEEVGQLKNEFEEEHGTDGGALDGLEGARGVTKGNVQDRVMELKDLLLESLTPGTPEHEQVKQVGKTTFGSRKWEKGREDEEGLFEELDILHEYLQLTDEEAGLKKAHKQALKDLHVAVRDRYSNLTEDEIQTLVIEDKWFAQIRAAIEGEAERLTERLAARIRELEARYARPLPELEQEVATLAERVQGHLETVGGVGGWG